MWLSISTLERVGRSIHDRYTFLQKHTHARTHRKTNSPDEKTVYIYNSHGCIYLTDSTEPKAYSRAPPLQPYSSTPVSHEMSCCALSSSRWPVCMAYLLPMVSTVANALCRVQHSSSTMTGEIPVKTYQQLPHWNIKGKIMWVKW